MATSLIIVTEVRNNCMPHAQWVLNNYLLIYWTKCVGFESNVMALTHHHWLWVDFPVGKLLFLPFFFFEHLL